MHKLHLIGLRSVWHGIELAGMRLCNKSDCDLLHMTVQAKPASVDGKAGFLASFKAGFATNFVRAVAASAGELTIKQKLDVFPAGHALVVVLHDDLHARVPQAATAVVAPH